MNNINIPYIARIGSKRSTRHSLGQSLARTQDKLRKETRWVALQSWSAPPQWVRGAMVARRRLADTGHFASHTPPPRHSP